MDQTITMIAPEAILADDNARFNLLETRLDKLSADILRDGQVNDAIEVEPLVEPVNGCSYRVTVGHYRHAAGLKLNKEQNAGLMLPAVVKSRVDEKDRVIRQVSENMDRQNLTPMDSAVAIKRMMDIGVPKLDILKAFSRPNVKGKLAPASNAWANMMVSFLSLPKAIQRDIHLGIIPVSTAYELTKAPKDKVQEILADAKAARDKEYAAEDKIEEKFLADEKKLADLRQKELEAAAEVEKAKADAESIQAQLKAKREAAIAAYSAKNQAEGEEKKKADEAHKVAEKEAQEAEKAYTTAVKTVEKAGEKVESAAKLAKEKEAKLKAARSGKAKPDREGKAGKVGKAVTPADVKAATERAAGKNGLAPLKAIEIKDVINTMSLPNGDAPKLQAIGQALMACFFGLPDATQLTTPTQLMTTIREIVGEDKKKK